MSGEEPFDHLARQFLNRETELIRKTPSLFEELQSKQRYSDKKLWAEGGMKRIYQVYDHSTGRHMAMAELKPELGKTYIKAFLREARLTAALDHPNIVSIHEIGIHNDKRPFFTMDFFSNRTLTNLIEDHQQYSLRDRLDIFIKVCDAIAYAHAKGVLHLDIKSPNIHVGKYGEVWVSDWGLGKSLEEHDPNESSLIGLEDIGSLNHLWTNHQGIKGTPGNIAPEQIESYEYANKLSDVYALGCLLYEMCTLQKPFHGDAKEILNKTLKGNWTDPKKLNAKNISNSLNAVIKKAMALDQDERYQSVQDLKKDIELFLHGYTTEAENASFIKQASLFFWRYRIASFVAICSAVTLLFISYFFIKELSLSTRRAQSNATFAFEQTQKIAKMAAELGEKREEDINATQNSTLGMVNILLKSLNPGWDGMGLELDLQKESLFLSSPDLRSLYYNQTPHQMCVLQHLNFKKLTLSGSGVSNLSELKGLEFHTLDLRDSKITQLYNFDLIKVKRLILNTQQFPEIQLSRLPEDLEIILQK